MKKQEYLDLKKRHQKELNAFPIAYAFNDEQLQEALTKLGATKEECVTVFGHGDIVRRGDDKLLIELLGRQTREIHRKLRDDHEFAEAAFRYEMDNHEYAINITGDEDVLDCFQLTLERLRAWDLESAYRKARRQHMKYALESEMI